nr:MAG TPA: hypothetical protein [Caudoviricetes sp.]
MKQLERKNPTEFYAGLATLWQAYCLLEAVITADAQADELSNVLTALHGIKSLMFSGLEELDKVA